VTREDIVMRIGSLPMIAAALLVASVAYPCSEHASHRPIAEPLVVSGDPVRVGPWVSGSWYDPERSGEGFIVQYLPDDRALAMWFTFPAAGEEGAQAWILAQDGYVDGNTLRFPTVYRTFGGTFGDAFDPDAIERVAWGTLDIGFDDCNRATATYTGPATHGSGTRTLTRLSSLDELQCDGSRDLTPAGARALSGLRSTSGAWFVPNRSGEGWFIENLPDARSLVYWFTFDPQGHPAWTLGVGTRSGNRIVVQENAITRGTRFGPDFNPDDVERELWGTLTFEFSGCDSARVDYASVLPGYGSRRHDAVRLTRLAGAPCIDGTPKPRLAGTWTEKASLPAASQSEHAVTTLDGQLYALGGFGDLRAFKRFDPEANQWTRLPDLPAGRHHLAAFALDGGVFFVGGEMEGGGDQSVAAFRYDVADGTWSSRPELRFMFGSHAAVLHGRAYIGSQFGSLQEYDPRSREVRFIPQMDATPRDHSQVVAFLDEIWVIAGRQPETRKVSIYDPVSDRWRAGPSVARWRGGFAAAVVGHQIVIGGGEVLGATAQLEPSVEVYTAGEDVWRFAAPLPVPVHGVAGAAIDDGVFVVSGSTIAGSRFGATGRVFAITYEE
jgi:hypothetical protein